MEHDVKAINKIIKVANKMTDDKEKNKKIVQKNYASLYKILNSEPVLYALVDIDFDSKKLLAFNDTFSFNDHRDYIIYRNIVIKQSAFYDKNKNNFFQYAIEKGYDYEVLIKLSRFFNESIVCHQNNNGETLIHILLKKCIHNPNILTDTAIVKLFSNAIKLYDYSLTNFNGDDVISLLNTLKSVSKTIGKNNEILSQNINEMFKVLYINRMIFLLKVLTGNKKKDCQMIEEIFGSINYCDEKGSLLTYFVKELRFADLQSQWYIDQILNEIEKLLKYGVNPNLKDKNGETFIHIAISQKNKIELLNKLIEMAIQYGFDVNTEPTLIKKCLKEKMKEEDVINIYRLLSINGFNSLNIDFNSIRDDNYIDLNYYHHYMRCIDSFNLQLQSHDLMLESDFKIKIDNSYNEFSDIISYAMSFSQIDTMEELVELWVEAIIEKREENINLADKEVTLSESLEALKYLVFKVQMKVEKEIDDFKKKILKND